MTGFLSKLFGSGKKDKTVISLVEESLDSIIQLSGFDLSFNCEKVSKDGGSEIHINLSGADEDLLKDKKGQLLDSFQLILKRIVQHNFADDKTNIFVDTSGYREESENALIERAENLKNIAIEVGKAVYYRALPPKERKIVHQYLAQDPRVKSRSLGDGLYKKIKIYPAKNNNTTVSAQAEVLEAVAE